MKKLLLQTIFLLCCSNVLGLTNYVWQGSPSPTSPFNSWETASHSIQYALSFADEGNVVLVTNGVYTFLTEIKVSTNNLIIKSVNGAAETIISGSSAGRCIYLTGNNCVIDGFLIRNGSSSGDGGGIYVKNNGTIINCSFTNNTCYHLYKGGAVFGRNVLISNCYFKENIAGDGGGVSAEDNSLIINCVFEYNHSTNYSSGFGGAIYGRYKTTISDCVIISNSSQNTGGGIDIRNTGMVVNCQIKDNTGNLGGGIFFDNNSVISNCLINGNKAGYLGGGILIGDSKMSNCIISENHSDNKGGGIYNYSSFISDCEIKGNNADEIGGGVYCSRGLFENCLIFGANSAKIGGGVYSYNSEFYNCTIAGNFALSAGGGIACTNGVNVVNTIIYNNIAAQGANWQNYYPGNPFVYSYCCTVPTNDLPNDYQCIPDNPNFISSGVDYHLQETSPCRNSGTNMAWMIGSTDLDGNPRIIGDKVDMGCYEFVPEPGIYLLFIIYQLLFINYCKKKRFLI